MAKPTHVARAPIRKGDKTRWVDIGQGWEMITRDEKVFISLKLDTLPIDKTWDGQINIFPYETADEQLD